MSLKYIPELPGPIFLKRKKKYKTIEEHVVKKRKKEKRQKKKKKKADRIYALIIRNGLPQTPKRFQNPKNEIVELYFEISRKIWSNVDNATGRIAVDDDEDPNLDQRLAAKRSPNPRHPTP
jgi:predicted oxidoreductase (fatty acid repression mutant protein)